jgi:peptidoglycan/LPS O-acetylase OafA/YrhL
MGAGSQQGYRPEIDGLRAVAVLPVVLFHAGFSLVPGGFVGVDVFFVISGYLITSILYREAREGRFSVLRFYERRIRRIFPALFVMLAACFVVGWFILLPDRYLDLARDGAATTLFASNITFWLTTGYFDTQAAFRPLLHTWSLAVEEQYYILFPLALWAIVRWRVDRVALAIGLLALLSLALSIWMVSAHASAAFYLLPSRAWELLIGSLLAVAPAYTGRHGNLIAFAGLGAIAAAVLTFREGMPFPGASALLPTLGAAAVIYGAQGTLAGRLLSLPPMRGVGLISYSFYLWHWPVIVFARILNGGYLDRDAAIPAVLLSLVLATLSWRFVEQPVRVGFSKRQVWALGGGCIAAGLAAGLTLMTLDGAPQRLSPPLRQEFEAASARKDFVASVLRCEWREGVALSPVLHACPIGASEGAPRIAIVGDSHAAAMADGLDAALRELGVSGTMLAVAGCAPVLELARTDYGRDCPAEHARAFEYVRTHRPEAVLLIGSWRGELGWHATRYRGRLATDEATRLANARDAIANTIEVYRGLGVRVGVALPVPGAQREVMRERARAMLMGFEPAPLEISRADYDVQFGALIAAMEGAQPDAVVDTVSTFCLEACSATQNETGLYYDEAHLTAAGAALLVPELKRAIAELLAEQAPNGAQDGVRPTPRTSPPQ